ncbi:RraA family protein [Peribacillus acanthi]|uniref:RraA family protein n=1 Tax=Peribacillus acanthi TaxID=2171554 RepID=UPI000D3E2CF8|nr:RraA family protein [Peribacillus acanthi]
MSYSKEVIEKFYGVASASVADAVDQVVGKTGYMDFEIKPRINDRKVVGPAVTVKEVFTEEKLPPVHALEAIDESPEGSVVVIGLEGSDRNVAVWGGLMTAGAYVNNLAGAILDAGVRDVTEIKRDYGFPVYSRSISPGTTVGRYKTEALNVPVECGGITVHPGDLIVADLDGVVVVPKAHVEEVLEKAIEIEVREAEQTKLIKSAKSLRAGIEQYNRI